MAEARSRLPTIVAEAEAGREIELTRRGLTVAVVTSVQAFERLRGARRQFGETCRAFREQHPLDEIGLDDNFPIATRDRTEGRNVIL